MKNVKITKDNVASLLSNIHEMARREVLVGVPGEKAARRGEPINNAALAAIHDRGSPVNNIPARPFMEPGIDKALPKIENMLRKGAERGLANPGAVEVALNQAGLTAVASIKNVIVSQEGFAPLKPGTLKARERKNFKGKKALIQTAQMMGAITHVVRDR